MEKPLVTFIVLGYKHAKYIRLAIEGAFAQTYSPLEIILSDDGSSDETFQIMEEMASGYEGEHTVVLNRNEKNLGIADHFNFLGRLMKGEFLIISAGDDISLPHRTETICNKWLKSSEQVDLVYSAALEVSEEGEELYLRNEAWTQQNLPKKSAKQLIAQNNFALGATCAISPRILREFPPLMAELICEDHAWPLRVRLRGGEIVYIDEPLVEHRCGGAGVQLPDRIRILDYQQKIIDIQSQSEGTHFLKSCQRYLSFWKLRVAQTEGRFNEEASKHSRLFLCWFKWKVLRDGLVRRLGIKNFARRLSGAQGP